MPEIKHNFTKGKMNKDLDERIVANGEYRDAMNIQVSTSDGSDIGAIQNILGNKILGAVFWQTNLSQAARCIGSIASEKNNKLYYFVADPNADYIIEYDTNSDQTLPVFTDISKTILGFDSNTIITGINIIDDMLFWTDNNSEPRKINITRCKAGTKNDGTKQTEIVNEAQGHIGGMPLLPLMEEQHTTVIKKAPLNPIIIDTETFRDKSKHYTAYIETSNSGDEANDFINSSKGRIHDFSLLRAGDTFRTYLNSITGLSEYSLEWNFGDEVVLKEYDPNDIVPNAPITDYRIKGTIMRWEESSFATIDTIINSNGNFSIGSNSYPYNWNYSGGHGESFRWHWTGNKLSIQESPGNFGFGWPEVYQAAWSPLDEDIVQYQYYTIKVTVSPSTYIINQAWAGELYVELNDNAEQYATNVQEIGTITSFGTHTFAFQFDNHDLMGPPQKANSVIFTTSTDGNGDFFRGSIDNVVVERVYDGITEAAVEVRVNSILGTPPVCDEGETSLKYAIDLFDKEEKLFEFKFARFAYRYKYIDGEYSTFSPFSPVTFEAGGFDYHPKKGYNKGMTNQIKSIKLKGFLSNLPLDVSSVDILYKEEDSPNIYIVDTIKDFNKTEYKITSETLKNGLTQSNQLLRPWDNVPRKALAQEVIGNRIVYGNYLQNYDLIDSVTTQDYSIDLLPEVLSRVHPAGEVGVKSMKSLREYQVGIVYADKYGRQTPILTNEKATAEIGKNKAESINELRISIGNSGHPVNMEYFKFYIKEISGQYYNMAMDRYYDAEDDNIWIAFPSSDRNKVDIDDFIILKKGVDKNTLIKEAARYKVIDIQNEAPDHIKRNEFMIASKRHSNTTGLELFSASDIPNVNDNSFAINYGRIKNSSFSNLTNEFNSRINDKYFITLHNDTISKVSERYELIALNVDDPVVPTTWNFTLKKSFESEINEFTDDPKGDNSTIILDDTYLNIYKSSIDNSPKFDGRFFVKIHNDNVFSKNIVKEFVEGKTEYQAVADGARKIYSLETEADSDRILKHFKSNGDPEVFDITLGPSSSPNLSPNVVSNKDDLQYASWNSYIKATGLAGYFGGTLNDRGSWGVAGADPGAFIGSRWMHYDAYFRGFNVDPDGISARKEKMDIHGSDSSNQAFEDVWFIDKSKNAGGFENSNNSPSSGWDSSPNPQNGTGIGVANYTGRSRIELAFGGIQPNKWPTLATDSDPSFTTDSTFYDLENGNLNYSSTQGNFIKNLSVGSQFRFKEDPIGTIYTITDVDIYFKLRYEDITTGAPPEGDSITWLHHLDYLNPEFNTISGGVASHAWANKQSIYPLQVKMKNGAKAGPGGTSDNGYAYFGPLNSIEEADGSTSPWVTEGVYKTSSFLRASNFTKNYRIWLDKEIEWDPFQSSVSKIVGGQDLRLTLVNQTHGVNYVDVTSITSGGGYPVAGPQMRLGVDGDTQTNPSVFEAKREIEVGMVIETGADGDAIVEQDTNGLVMLPMVSKIEEGVGAGSHRVYFKNYNGGNNLTGTGVAGTLDVGSGSAQTMVFKQYPMNGLSPNSAKNLNYFKSSIGFGPGGGGTGGFCGTDALGYTIEFIKLKEFRPEENIIPQNPAIWETEPKAPETDLDIYHAVGGFHTINIPDITEFIPVGSIIQHENSNAIPPNTTITSVDANGEIHLSETITIDPITRTNTGDGSEPNWGAQIE